MKLVVVESPNKAKTIEKYLGEGYRVLATRGHVRDLPQREIGVDPITFTPTYVVLEDKASALDAIRKAAKEASDVILATDKDREGEAIAWHIREELHLKGAKRMRLGEVTPKAIQAGIAAAGELDEALVDAQEMRRIVDRFVGYQLSPALRVFGDNHSAGRVQTAALHLLVQRELERDAHVPVPYWLLTARYAGGLVATYAPPKPARTASSDDAGDPPAADDTRIHSQEEADAILARAQGPHVVASVDTEPGQRRPKPPFTTASLEQAAGRLLKSSADATMRLAQHLFELGHISYHRTDSVAVSDDAARMAREWLLQVYPAAVPETPPKYKQAANAQAAHECIRPTSLDVAATAALQGAELELYELIRARFVASQCKPALISATIVTIKSGDTAWRARAVVVTFDSFRNPRIAGDVDEEATKGDDAPTLPAVTVGQTLTVATLDAKRRETTAPPRYNFGTFPRALDASGIVRPSTGASTIATLIKREYAEVTKEEYVPTSRGRLIEGVLSAAFPALVEASYTAELEAILDEVADGKRSGRAELGRWYAPWTQQLAAALPLLASAAAKHPELAANATPPPQPTGKPCPLCGKELLLRHLPKRAPFLACSGYPACTYAADPSARPSDAKCPVCGGATEAVDGKHGPYARCLKRCEDGYVDLRPRVASDKRCPKCNGPMRTIDGKHGPYARCDSRTCDGTVDLRPRVASDKLCPKCQGPMHQLDGKFGPYARCDKADCDGTVDLRPPSKEPCPVCGGPMRDKGDFLSCAGYPDCRGSWDKKALAAARKANRKCPKCKTRLLAPKKGGAFWGCSGYPLCTHREDAPVAAPKKASGGRR